MMKKYFLTAILILSCIFAWSQETADTDTQKNESDIKNTVSMNIVIPVGEEFISDYLAINGSYTFENSFTTASAGIQTAKSNIKFYLSDTYWLYSSDKINLGIKALYNFNHYNDLVTYNTFMAGGDFEFNFGRNFRLNTQLLIDFTVGLIDTGYDENLSIHWWDAGLKVSLFYKLPVKPDFEIFLDMANYDNFTVQRFFAPIITTGVKYTSPYHFSVGAEVNIHYTDIFSFSRYIEYAAFTIKGEYLF